MGIKIRTRRNRKNEDEEREERRPRRRRLRKVRRDDHVEVGRGPFCVLTINRHDGSTVVQRFATEKEAMAQHERNVAEDKPLVGLGEVN
ncbi:MAG: hypothetical protein ACOCV2_02770 [Persicimonas sp.]